MPEIKSYPVGNAVEKADLALADLIDNGGVLTEEQSRVFYMSMASSQLEIYQQWVDHHFANMRKHTANRNYDYAAGSLRKAHKWIARIDKLTAEMNTVMFQMKEIVANQIAKDMEELLLYGDGKETPIGILGNATD